MDTKPSAEADTGVTWASDPFTLTVDRAAERLYGLGACDAKGSLAAQIAAAGQLIAEGGWHGTLEIHATSDEEDGAQYGAQVLYERGLTSADAAIIGEPTSVRYSPAQLGNAWARVTLQGAPAHAGRPDRGRDAVWAAHEFMAAVRERVALMPADPRFPGHPRLNVGRIDGGSLPGSVPGRCELLCDIRVLPGQDRDGVHQVYQEVAEQVSKLSGVTITAEFFQGGGCQSNQVSEDAAIVTCFQDAAKQVGADCEPMYFLGGSDARFYARAGTPAIVFGPGDLAVAHAPNEYVRAAELSAAVDLLYGTARRFLSATGPARF